MNTIGRIRPVLDQCLRAAGEIQRASFMRVDQQAVETKAHDYDLLTIVDTDSENAIVDIIRQNFPDHHILTEEAGALANERQTPGQPDAADAAPAVRWVIDPLDGTTNYSHGFPAFGISIGIELDGVTQLGAVYNPVREELYQAQRGHGATLNGQPIHVSAADELGKALLVTGFPYDRRERIDHYLALYRAFTMKAHGVLRLGSAALDLCHVASGQLDGYYEESLNPWDWTAGWLILEEAGGKVSDYHGEGRVFERRQLCASNTRLHQQMLDILGPSVS
ncbi:inositol monophosphatase family protein [Candidatus Sumerlaeota bacterium]